MIQQDNSLILIIDFQEKLLKATVKDTAVIENGKKLLKTANLLNIPAIITEQYPQGLGATIEEIKSSNPQAHYFEKTSFSAFSTACIKEAIEATCKKQIILCGVEAHICVLQTALELKENGFDVYVIKDACASRKIENFDNAFSRLIQAGITVSDTETTLFEFLKSSKHPNFKEIQALIK